MILTGAYLIWYSLGLLNAVALNKGETVWEVLVLGLLGPFVLFIGG
jgi:hypothetical protein